MTKKKNKKGSISKRIDVEDRHGNKHVLKATVISVSKHDIKKQESAEITDERLSSLGISERIINPPLSQRDLAVLSEFSSELPQVIETMAMGIEGFGGRLKKRKMSDIVEDKNKVQIMEEKAFLTALFKFPNPTDSFVQLRKNTRSDREQNGNAYWELIRGNDGVRYTCINKLDVSSMLILKADRRFSRMKLKYVDEQLNLRSKLFSKKFRGFVQIIGSKKVYFKEFGDSRVIDRRSGDVSAKSVMEWENQDKEERLPKNKWANEVYHFKIPTRRRTPYGLPRYTGNIIAIKGSRSADETNIITQENNHVPSMAILISGGQLTDGSIERIQEFVDIQIKDDSNYSKFLILEAESFHDNLSGVGSTKVEIKSLVENQHKDQLWQKYDENNAAKLRRNFRLPPVMVGKTEDLNRATAQESERLAEKWVFNPEREEMDNDINKILLSQGFRFWEYKSNSPNVTNDEDLVEILKGGEKSGGMTPNISRSILIDIKPDLEELPPVPPKDPETGWDPDMPFSWNLALLMKGMANANQNGTLEPQGQIPKPPKDNGRPRNEATKIIDPDEVIKDFLERPERALEVFTTLRDRLEDELDIDVFGETKRDYFDHAG